MTCVHARRNAMSGARFCHPSMSRSRGIPAVRVGAAHPCPPLRGEFYLHSSASPHLAATCPRALRRTHRAPDLLGARACRCRLYNVGRTHCRVHTSAELSVNNPRRAGEEGEH